MSSDTTPLLNSRRTTQPGNRGGDSSYPNSHGNSNRSNPTGYRPNNNSSNAPRHWSEETEDISTGPDTDGYGPGHRRRGGAPSTGASPYSDLDAQRFSGQNRPTGLKRLLCGCCCLPCRRAYTGFQDRYTKTEKYAMGFALLFFGLAVAFFVALVHALEAIPDSGKNGICTSRECTIVAADILRDMKPGVDPCTDFFDFACGGFVDRVPIPDDKPKIGYFDVVQKQNQEVIRSILSPESTNVQKSKDDAKKRNLIKLQSLYESCTDEKKISEAGVKPLLDLIQNMVKVLPTDTSVLRSDLSPSALKKNLKVLQDINNRMINSGEYKARADAVDTFTKGEKDNLALAISQLTLIDLSSMVDFNVDADPKNPDVNVLFLDESGLGLPSKEYYDDEKIVATYQKVVEDMFTIVMGKGKDVDMNDASSAKPSAWAEVAKNIVEFEKRLAKISSDPEDLRNSEITYNPRSLSQISELIPTIDWSLLIEKLIGKGNKVPNPIIVSMPEYLQKLNTLLKDTPAVTLQNYFAWRLVRKLSANLAVELQKPMQQLRAVLEGVSEDLVTPRWETCVDVVNNAMGPLAGYYFIEKSFKGDSKDMADDIITSLRTSFTKGLTQLAWLDKETCSNATEKVDLLTQKVGYSTTSPDVRSPDSLEEYFKNLVADKGDFFGNQIRARTWKARKLLSDLDRPVDKAKWLMDPQTVNAYYNPTANEIVFPAGILQQPYFHVDNPEYLNFGSIGAVAGHELTHAFDNEGRLYDARGKLVDWWTNATLQHFQDKSQCFIDQYGNFTIKDPQGRENHVNGKLTLGENLADNGGLKNAFNAWETRFNGDSRGNKYKNHLLSGLGSYTREQLFYISYARSWCSQRRPASAIEGLRTDEHSPPRWRVNGAVQNSEHFAQVFNCKPRSSMNPDNKCDLW